MKTNTLTDPVSRKTFDQVMVPTYSPSEVLLVRGQGLEVWAQRGARYLDFTGGIAVCSLGHAHPAIVEALRNQAETIWHVGNGYTNEPVLRLASALTAATFADRAFFCNSGAEANEAALKLARKYAHEKFGAGKSKIISCVNAFHGRTLFTVSVGGQPKYTEGYEPLPQDISHIAFNDIEAARAAIGTDVCAVIVEPIQGEGGILPAAPEYLKALRELCDSTGALLIFDEVQCGMGRTGELFAYMHYGVVPDILTTAKALGNGYPVGAMLTTDKIASAFSAGSHGTTYGGNPLAAAVALKVLSIIDSPLFLDRVKQASRVLTEALQTFVGNYPQVFKEVRGTGLMLGLVLTEQYRGRAKEITKAAEAQGLLLLIAGADVVRFLPALIVSDEQISEAMSLLQRAVKEFLSLNADIKCLS
ncbi:MAG TPA: acetylornithine/succinylornithine family transaminase [Undibacterium sp.]|nr:acetylornithine/succinylornithine family transaminase [Undibacterium sp.]HTD05213.1 acetylornithine/succinylornithine family transaminase [Undibacterium sp.]